MQGCVGDAPPPSVSQSASHLARRINLCLKGPFLPCGLRFSSAAKVKLTTKKQVLVLIQGRSILINDIFWNVVPQSLNQHIKSFATELNINPGFWNLNAAREQASRPRRCRDHTECALYCLVWYRKTGERQAGIQRDMEKGTLPSLKVPFAFFAIYEQ